jgi:hypothetical protein
MFDTTARDYADYRRREAALPNLAAHYREQWEQVRALDRLERQAAIERARLGISPKPAILQP